MPFLLSTGGVCIRGICIQEGSLYPGRGGGGHPTGMHTCFIYSLLNKSGHSGVEVFKRIVDWQGLFQRHQYMPFVWQVRQVRWMTGRSLAVTLTWRISWTSRIYLTECRKKRYWVLFFLWNFSLIRIPKFPLQTQNTLILYWAVLTPQLRWQFYHYLCCAPLVLDFLLIMCFVNLANDVCSWTDPENGEEYVGMSFVQITDPENPAPGSTSPGQTTPLQRPLQWTVHILLECILVLFVSS